MPPSRKLPLVAVCGRPNVGKSTLFNRIRGRQQAIVHYIEGVTRDRAYGTAEWKDKAFRIVDTGGIVEDPEEIVVAKMQQQVQAALEEAKVILFVVDGQQELTRIDFEFCENLFKLGKPVVLAVNKLDNHKIALNIADFYSLGIGEPLPLSATHGIGIDPILDAIVELLPEQPKRAERAEGGEGGAEGDEGGAEGDEGGAEDNEGGEEGEEEDDEGEDSVTKVAIVGKPNVGKSSFVNAILNAERLIVDSVPGTTRDAIDIEFSWKGKEYLLIDTAGMRKKAGIRKHVEFFSVSRSLRAVRRADVCLVMVDATEGITEQDKRVLDYVRSAGTAFILVWTKWDLIDNKEKRFKELADEVDFKAPFVKHAPFLTISNLSRQRLFKTFEFIDRTAAEAKKRISTGELNRFIEELRGGPGPSSRKGRPAKVQYATQAGVKPTVFVLFVNRKELFHFSHLRFLENRIRDRYGFQGVPIQLELREGKPREPKAKRGEPKEGKTKEGKTKEGKTKEGKTKE